MSVMTFHKLINFKDQIFDASESSSPDCSLGDEIKPDLDLIQPGSIGRRIVDLISGMSHNPTLDLGVFMSGVIIHHQVND